MNKFLYRINAFLICVVFLFAACETTDPTSTGDDDEVTKCGDVSQSTKDFYEDDAVRLAIQFSNASGDESIIVPPALIERMSDVLTAVHSSEYAARDSVVDVYDVHIFPSYPLDVVSVEVSSDSTAYPWVGSWLNSERFTGNSQIDGLISTYDLDVSGYINTNSGLLVFLTSEDPINTVALANRFTDIEGVLSSSVQGESGDGDNIEVMVSGDNDSYKVIYDVAYDDCENACQKHRLYEFSVDDNCNVQYINTTGDPAPSESERDEE